MAAAGSGVYTSSANRPAERVRAGRADHDRAREARTRTNDGRRRDLLLSVALEARLCNAQCHPRRPIETSHAALVPCGDEHFREITGRYPAVQTFVGAFSDEFGAQISPTIGLVREDAPRDIATTQAFGGFRDALCVSAVVAGQSLALKWGPPPHGIIYSDAFDIYPWFPEPGSEKYVSCFTPTLHTHREVGDLRPQSAPALGNRSLSLIHVDRPLLQALFERWEHCFAAGHESVEDRRLFRALEMACAASRIPGGTDASEHHFGRAVALWVSAFENLGPRWKMERHEAGSNPV